MSLFAELKRRNVIRVGVAYCAAGWVIAQLAEFAFENFGTPEWVFKTVVTLLLLGLPLALIFAWAFELTPEGIKRERDVAKGESITPQTGRTLDKVIIGILVIAVGWFAWDKFLGGADPATAVESSAGNTEPAAVVTGKVVDKSVAVLPFVARSSGEDDEYFADGLTEEILNSLAQLPELLVTARTSAFSFKGQNLPVQEIAAALGVQHVVEGSVRRAGERLRVSVQLVRAEDGFQLWSENYDDNNEDTIAVQEDIAEKIAAALDVVMDADKREAMRKAGLRDAEAFTLYQKGLDYYARAHGEMDLIEGLEMANGYFDQVIERVPDYTPVYLKHSDLYVHRLSDDASGMSGFKMSDEEVDETLAALVADHEAAVRYAKSDSWRAVAQLDQAFVSGDWRSLDSHIEYAIEHAECDSGNWLSILADPMGHSGAFLDLAEKLLACDPRASLSWFTLARSTLRAGDPEKALAIAREGMEIAPGTWLSGEAVFALAASGLHDQAMAATEQLDDDPLFMPLFKAMVAASEGNVEMFNQQYYLVLENRESGNFLPASASAWAGNREVANEYAARMDSHPFGYVPLIQLTQWCACGAPWDLDHTPNFAQKIDAGALNWPPPAAIDFPLKNW